MSRLGPTIAIVLRAGSVIAVVAIGVGYAIAALGRSEGPGPTPVGELLASGGADALIGVGLLALVLTPTAALSAATVALWRAGERPRAATAALVVLLLLAALAAAALLGGAS